MGRNVMVLSENDGEVASTDFICIFVRQSDGVCAAIDVAPFEIISWHVKYVGNAI